MGRFMQSFQSLAGYRRATVAIDLFVFDGQYPFEELNSVVVGRFYVDSEVMRYSHVHQMPIVDLSFLQSFHQGLTVSNELKGVVDPQNLEYNRPLLGSFDVNDTVLSSSYYVMWSVCWNEIGMGYRIAFGCKGSTGVLNRAEWLLMVVIRCSVPVFPIIHTTPTYPISSIKHFQKHVPFTTRLS